MDEIDEKQGKKSVKTTETADNTETALNEAKRTRTINSKNNEDKKVVRWMIGRRRTELADGSIGYAEWGEHQKLGLVGLNSKKDIVEEKLFTLWSGSYEDMFTDINDVLQNLDFANAETTEVPAGGLIPTADGREILNETGAIMTLIKPKYIFRK